MDGTARLQKIPLRLVAFSTSAERDFGKRRVWGAMYVLYRSAGFMHRPPV
jgi:hypothetical protein